MQVQNESQNKEKDNNILSVSANSKDLHFLGDPQKVMITPRYHSGSYNTKLLKQIRQDSVPCFYLFFLQILIRMLKISLCYLAMFPGAIIYLWWNKYENVITKCVFRN